MTTAYILQKDGGYSVEITGHNKTNICAAISALTAALSGWCDNFDSKYAYTEQDGYCYIETTKAAKQPIIMLLIGLKRLEITYPNKVRVITNF